MFKKLALTLLISGKLFLPDFLFGQAKIDLLYQEINYVVSKNLPIKSISIQKDSNWVMLYGLNQFSATNLDTNETKTLNRFVQNNQEIIQILKQDTMLILIHQSGMICKSCEPLLTKKLMQLKNRKHSIQHVFLSNNNFAIIYNQNRITTDKYYPGLQEKIEEINQKYLKIKQIIIYENEWLVSYGKAGISASKIPVPLQEAFEEIKNNEFQINHISVFKNMWFIIYDQNKLKFVAL